MPRSSNVRAVAEFGALVLLLALAACPALAQSLDLPGPATAPEIEGESALAALRTTLEAETTALVEDAARGRELDQLVARARIGVREVAGELLKIGDDRSPDTARLAVAGLTLAHGRTAIDEALGDAVEAASAPGADAEAGATLIERLRAFSVGVMDEVGAISPDDPDAAEESLADLLLPLAALVWTVEGRGMPGHWIHAAPEAPSASSRAGRLAAAALEASAPPDDLGSLHRRLELSDASDGLRAALDRILGWLDRGSDFPELAPAVASGRRAVSIALRVVETLEHARRLDDRRRRAIEADLLASVLAFEDPERRPAGRQGLRALDVTRRIVHRLDLLDALQANDRPDPSMGEVVLDLDARARAAMTESAPGAADPRMPVLVILDRLVAARLAEPAATDPRVGIVAGRLNEQRRRAERALVARLIETSEDFLAPLDPDAAALMAHHEATLESWLLVHRIPGWEDRIRRLAGDVADRCGHRALRLAERLAGPLARADAMAALRAFEDRLERIDPVPWEADLRDGAPAAVEATAGRHRALLDRVESARVEWLDRWSRGRDVEEAAATLDALLGLLTALVETAEAREAAGDRVLLDCWAAWELGPVATARLLGDVPGRLKLAVSAAVDGDRARLLRQLRRLNDDAAMIRLMGRLADRLGPMLEPLPAEATGTLGQLVHGPPPGGAGSEPTSWPASHRTAFAVLCRAAVELEHARIEDRPDDVRRLRAFVDDRAAALLEVVPAATPGR